MHFTSTQTHNTLSLLFLFHIFSVKGFTCPKSCPSGVDAFSLGWKWCPTFTHLDKVGFTTFLTWLSLYLSVDSYTSQFNSIQFRLRLLCLYISLEDEEEHPLQLDIETTALNMSILRTFPCVGTVLRVITDVDVTLHIQQMGQWVKVRNMKIDNRSGFWFGTFLPTTKLRFLLDDEQTVQECKR